MANDNETLMQIARSMGSLEGSFKTFSENVTKRLDGIDEFQLHIKTKWDDGFKRHVQYVETELKNNKKDMEKWLDEKSLLFKNDILHKVDDDLKPLKEDFSERKNEKIETKKEIRKLKWSAISVFVLGIATGTFDHISDFIKTIISKI